MSVVVFLLLTPLTFGTTEVIIKKGDGLNVIADKLDDARLLRNKALFKQYIKFMGYGNELKAGNYSFTGPLNIIQITSLIVNGRSNSTDIRILIPEGYNIWQIDEVLVRQGLIKEGQFSSEFYKDEGYLFPDTYRLHRPITDDPEEFSAQVIDELRSKMENNFNTKAGPLLSGLRSEEQTDIIIVASMLEKEVRLPQDMRLVAGIIYKRLGIDMPLQIDATVRYGACMRRFAKSNFLKNCDVILQGPALELKIDSPYNSYTRKNLPVGPISNPGVQSIQSALNPQESDYLYYLSAREDGRTIFSKTASEHVANRKKYLGI